MNTGWRTLQVVMLGVALLAAARPSHDYVRVFDVKHSKMTVYVYKQGIFAFAADNHEVDTPIASGSFDVTARTVEFTVDAKKMQVLDPPNHRAKVQANMVGPQVLDVDKYPKISFRSTKIDADDAGHWKVIGDLTLHGQTHAVTVEVVRSTATHFNGSTTIRQTQFGITPIKIAGGVVRVKDDVKVAFDIVLE